jgi:CheY-like chemotaxis protein
MGMILVIDDQEDIIELISTILKSQLLVIEKATSFKQGKNLLKFKRYDIVLTDINLANEKGNELYEYIRSDQKNANNKTPVIFMTGLEMNIDQNYSSWDNPPRMIGKPFSYKDLISIINETLGQ